MRTDAVGRLRDALVSLEATRDGFEGLTASLVSAATGGLLNLMSSGDQRGLDAIAGAGDGVIRRAMQAKRYRGSTPLDLNGLIGEMARAQASFIDIDCWILATTKPVYGKEAEDLAACATGFGWRFVAVDWVEDAGLLPRLAALCAAHPELTLAHAQCASLEEDLREIRERPDFSSALGAVVRNLTAVDVSFVHMRRAAFERLLSAFSDPGDGRRIAGASPALLAEAPPVRRAAVAAGIADWWMGETQTLALLGDEGMGKTWAALDAMRELSNGADAPIPLIVTSQKARRFEDGLSALIADIVDVAACGDVRPADPSRFWRLRLERWAKSQAPNPPRILMLIDGLDENDPFPWEDWLAPLRGSQWRSCVRLLLTCRRDDWERRVALRSTAEDAPSVRVSLSQIARFEPAERDAYLAGRGVNLGAVSPVVLEFARHPRTAFHLTRLSAELPDMIRVTREQLLLRDFENRRLIRDRGLRPEQFQELVRELAHHAQDAVSLQRPFAISEGAVVDAASSISGYDRGSMRSVLSELISGAWCQRRDGDPTRLEFVDAALPDAVGMAIASDIASLAPDAAAAEISRFLEPWGADDLVEGVLRTCATVLITRPDVSDELCSRVLELWHDRPMIHAHASQDFWRRLHVFRPQLFLDFADRNDSAHGWLVEWGLASFWEDYPDCRAAIEARIGTWLSVLPLPVRKQTDTPGYTRILNRDRRRQLMRLAALEKAGDGRWRERLGAEKEPGAPDRIRMAIRIIGFLPRTPFVSALTQWALTMAAAGRLEHGDGAAAIMRDFEVADSGCVTALRSQAEALAADGTALGRRAASIMLTLSGLPEDADSAAALCARPSPALPRFVVADNGEVDFAPETRSRDAVSNLAAIAPLAWRPDASLAPSLKQALYDDPLNAPLSRLLVRGKWTDTVATPLALRFGPTEALDDLRRYLLEFQDLEETDFNQRDDYRRVAQLSAPILSERERLIVARGLQEIAARDQAGPQAAIAYQMFDLDFSGQVALLLDSPFEAWPSDFRRLLAQAEPDALNALLERLDFRHDVSTDLRLAHLAEAVTPYGFRPAVAIDWSAGLTHPNAVLRFVATALACRCGVDGAAAILLAQSWSARSEETFDTRFAGSELLLQADDEALGAALDRLDDDNLLRAYSDRASLRVRAGDLLLERLRDWLLTPRTSRSFGGRFIIYGDRQERVGSLYRERRQIIADLFQAAYARADCRDNLHYGTEPDLVWPLLTEMAADQPEFVDTVWRSAIEARPLMRDSDLEMFPTRLAPGDTTDAMRGEVLRRARNDEHLADAVFCLQSQGHEIFVLNEVRRLVGEPRALDRAHGYTIAGFLGATSAAIALWEDERLARPSRGWLHDVHARSAAAFQEALHLKHWSAALAQETDEVAAWRAFWMLGRIRDRRRDALKDDPLFEIERRSFRDRWIRMQNHVWRSIATDRANERKARLHHTPRTDYLYDAG